MEPDISNPDDLYKLLTVCNSAGGLTPNRAKQIIYEAYGEVSEDYEGDWGNVPLNYSRTQQGGSDLESNIEQLTMSLQQQIVKAANNKDDEIVAVMKEVKRILKRDFSNPAAGGIIEKDWDEDSHPRDDNGQFASGGGSSSNLPTDSEGRPYSRPALNLPKKEYGKVMHSINDLYETRYKGETHGIIKIAGKNGYTMYAFEIHDFNEYNIHHKEKF